MLIDRESRFVFYSLGIVVNDKPKDSTEIDVTPIEEITNIAVPFKDYKPKYSVELPDATGVKKKSTVTGTATIKAKWLPLCNSNRMTAPDVIKNETVMIFRYSDTEDYYWNTMFLEPNIRRLEKVRYAFGNKDKPLEQWDGNSSYWVEVSTRKDEKWIKVHTSTNDGEKAGYDVTINGKEGFFEVKDTIGNHIKMDSDNKVTHLKALKSIVLEAPIVKVIGALVY